MRSLNIPCILELLEVPANNTCRRSFVRQNLESQTDVCPRGVASRSQAPALPRSDPIFPHGVQNLKNESRRMRLTSSQIETIRQTARQNFGADASVWLFGSRVDDARRGGDVDLYVESTQVNTLMSALRCKIALEDSLDLHVDLIVKEPGKDKPIYQLAKTQGVQL